MRGRRGSQVLQERGGSQQSEKLEGECSRQREQQPQIPEAGGEGVRGEDGLEAGKGTGAGVT